LLGEFQAAEQDERVAHRRHFGVADVAQILLDIGVHRRVGIQQPVGGGAVGAQIVHRLEDVRRGIGDDRMRLAACRRPQESQALSENPTTTQKEVTRMTVFSSADTVRRFNMMLPQICAHLEGKP
jgi:hypothetical protein